MTLVEDPRKRTPPDGEEVRKTVTSEVEYARVGPAPNQPPALVVVEGQNLGAIHPLGDEPLTIGRDLTNAVSIDDAGVSRFHAQLERLGERALVRDLGSKNGTWVDEEEIEERLLADGDHVRFGRTTFKFLAGDNLEHSYYLGMHTVAMHDPLTELPNRRYLEDVLLREMARARRYSRSLFLLMGDIDRFKAVNDEHGHLAGDMILRETGRLIRRRLRTSEFAARYGGEEFAFVLPESAPEGVEVFAEALRALIETHEFRCGGIVVPVTMSLGGAAWDPSMHETKDFVDRADENLYEAKRRGRNRFVL